MGHYFSLPQLGADSPDVESLGCYFYRLARAHDCSRWQLGRHLRAWSEAHGAGRPWRYFPSGMLHQSMSMCGYGSAVSTLVNSLQIATDVPTLRSGTLLPLQNVAARTAVRTLRTQRAWCPACYAEDLIGQDEPYDRLLWAILPIKRCITHKIELLTRCPTCGAPQDYARGIQQLTQCISCKGSLINDARCFTPAPAPFFGEKQIYELVGATASNPDLTLHWGSIATFFKRARRELSPNHPIRTRYVSFSRPGAYPTLESLLQLATTFNVSLLDFQTPEPAALNLPLYGPDCLPAGSSRPRQTQATYLQVEAKLKEMLMDSYPLPPFRDFCEELGVSKGFVSYRFPELSQSYLLRRRQARVATKEDSMSSAIQTVKEAGLWTAYREGRIKQKDVEREIVRLANVSVPTARAALSNYKHRR